MDHEPARGYTWHFTTVHNPAGQTSADVIRVVVVGMCSSYGLVRFDGVGNLTAISSGRPTDARVDIAGTCPE